MDYSVAGQRVVVVGAARSGIAAAELLARRGALVTITDIKPAIDQAPALARAGHRARAGRPRGRDVHGRGPDRGQPRREARSAGVRRGARRRRAGDRRAGAGVALAEGPGHRDHRHEGQVHDDDADGTDAREVGVHGAGRRQHRRAAVAQVDESTPDTLHVVEASSFQLETDRHVPPVDRGAAELLARPPGPAPDGRGLRGGQAADLRGGRRTTTWR